MSSSELDSRNIAISMRKSVENLVISSQDAIGQSISQALTFSGVIAQQTHQALQENRSVSRSPSPSPRNNSECAAAAGDNVESDKAESQSVGDSGSVGGDLAATVLRFGDKLASPPKSAEGRKKKSWYSSLYPTYKSRSEDFKRLFKEIPDDERLIVDYSCALQKEILAQGRLYVSQNYLCFYANIFGWETNLTVRWKDITAITKEKTALVIPNAILVCTDGDRHFFTSFSGRDKSYLMLFRVWQNNLMDQPISSQDIWHWVHKCYGEELGFNSDDEDYTRDTEDEKHTSIGGPEDLLETSSMDAGGESRTHAHDTTSLAVTNGDAEYREELGGDTMPTDMSDTSDSEPDKHHNSAECEKCPAAHDGKLILQQQFNINIDLLFTMLFTNSKMFLELLAARSTRDYVQAAWQHNPTTGLKTRQISYTLGLSSGPIGPKEVHVTETQVMNKCSKPGVLYSIDCTSENAGIPYADAFTVEAHYCLQRAGADACSFQIYGQVRYKKSLWPMVKGFLEKNAIGGLEDYIKLLEQRLIAESEGGAPAKRKGRRRRRGSNMYSSAAESFPPRAAPAAAPRAPPPRPRAGPGWLGAALLLLLLINALLYWRLYHADRGPTTFNIDDLQNRMSSLGGSGAADWSRLLEQHTRRQRSQLLAWRDALDRAVTHLTQTEQALTKLLESIQPSLQRAQREASDSHTHAQDEL